MKRIFTLIFCFFVSICLFGQGRLIESSDAKRPAWIKRDVDRYDLLKISVESTVSIEDARNNAFMKLHELAVNAVTTYLMKTAVGDADIAKVKSDVLNTQFMKNISENTSVDTYWEHRQNKKNDVYIYYILYDFNEFEMMKVALEINRMNSSSLKELNQL